MIYLTYLFAYLCIGWLLAFLWVRLTTEESKKTVGKPETPADVAVYMVFWPLSIFVFGAFIFFRTFGKIVMYILSMPLKANNR